jgi:hypothetical protein
MDDQFKPKFVRRYESLGTRIRTAVRSYVSDVRDGAFPSARESFGLPATASEEPAKVTDLGDSEDFNPYSSLGSTKS